MNRFCGSGYATATFGELESALVFPTATEHDNGLLFLHLPSHQMRLAQRTDFALLVKNMGSDPAHHSIYAKRYLDLCREIGMNCAAYYKAWTNMKESSKGTTTFGQTHYAETFNWHDKLAG